MTSNNQIKIGAIISYIAIVFNVVAGFIYTPWLISNIGESDYGLYTLVMSVISFFLVDFGISSTISRFISVYRAKNQNEHIGNLLGSIYKFYLLIDVAIFIILTTVYFFIDNIFTQFTIDEIYKLKNIFIIIASFSLISFPLMPLNGILTSYERFIQLRLFDLLQKICSILFIVVGIFCGGGLYTVVLINVLTNIIITTLKLIYINKSISLKVNIKNNDLNILKEIFSFSIWTTIISISQRLIINISPTLIGMFNGTAQVSLFSIGLTIEGYVFTFTNALNGLFLPKVTKICINNNKTDEIVNLMIKVGRIQLFIIGILIIGLTTMGKEFINLWLGSKFEISYYVSLLLIIPSIITMTQEIGINYLVAINAIKYRAYDYIFSAIVSIILSIILVPKYGAIGSALASSIGIILGHIIIMNIIYYKVFNLDIIKFFKECHLKMLIPMIICFFIGIIIQIYLPTNGLGLFIIKAVILLLIYIIAMWILAFNDYEKDLLKSIIRFIKNKKVKATA